MNAADWTPGIVSATSTSPFGNVCCSIVDEDARTRAPRCSGSTSAIARRAVDNSRIVATGTGRRPIRSPITIQRAYQNRPRIVEDRRSRRIRSTRRDSTASSSRRPPCRASWPVETRRCDKVARRRHSRRSPRDKPGAGPPGETPPVRGGPGPGPVPVPGNVRITPTFWIAPIGPRSMTPWTVPTYPSEQAINQVAPGRKPGLRRISHISRRQP